MDSQKSNTEDSVSNTVSSTDQSLTSPTNPAAQVKQEVISIDLDHSTNYDSIHGQSLSQSLPSQSTSWSRPDSGRYSSDKALNQSQPNFSSTWSKHPVASNGMDHSNDQSASALNSQVTVRSDEHGVMNGDVQNHPFHSLPVSNSQTLNHPGELMDGLPLVTSLSEGRTTSESRSLPEMRSPMNNPHSHPDGSTTANITVGPNEQFNIDDYISPRYRRTPWTWEQMGAAIESVLSKKNTLRQASIIYGIPRATLFDRVHRRDRSKSRPRIPRKIQKQFVDQIHRNHTEMYVASSQQQQHASFIPAKEIWSNEASMYNPYKTQKLQKPMPASSYSQASTNSSSSMRPNKISETLRAPKVGRPRTLNANSISDCSILPSQSGAMHTSPDEHAPMMDHPPTGSVEPVNPPMSHAPRIVNVTEQTSNLTSPIINVQASSANSSIIDSPSLPSYRNSIVSHRQEPVDEKKIIHEAIKAIELNLTSEQLSSFVDRFYHRNSHDSLYDAWAGLMLRLEKLQNK